MKIFLVLCFIAFCWKLYSSFFVSSVVSHGPGVIAPNLPEQKKIDSIEFKFDDYTMTQVASFSLSARVLSKKDYSFDRAADFSPTDLALGWSYMSDESVLKDIDISQSGRFYFWRVESFHIPRKEIETNSANMHLIPANDYVKRVIKKIRQGDLITLSGYLVDVDSDTDNWFTKSSRTRNDTGGGACEIIWVEDIRIEST